MSTYGEIRHRLALAAPGLSLDLIDGWILDRYTQILDRLQWRRKREQAVIQTAAPYDTGTVEVTEGSADIEGTGTTWTSEMTGRLYRVAGDNAFYEFTYVSNTQGSLDRVYEGASGAGKSYSIAQNVYQLPASCRVIEEARLLTPPRVLDKKSMAELNVISPHRGTYGAPYFFALFMDDASDPPRGQIELYPIPDRVMSVPIWFIADQDALSSTSATLLPWVRPGALIEGVMANISRDRKEFSGAREYESQFERLVGDMVRNHSAEQGSVQLPMAGRFTRHRRLRGFR